MSHYITVPVNENGIVFDTKMNDVVKTAMAASPFGFRDVYIYSHGWSTNADAALDLYGQFSVELSRLVLTTNAITPNPFTAPPADMLGVGIHWPSEITEDPTSILNSAQLLTFYTMEHRADAVGRNAVYTMLRLILAQRVGVNLPLRIFLVGHSFGCKVILAALQDVQTDIAGGTIQVPPGTEFKAALLQPATDADHLEPGDIYGSVADIQNLRLLITTSKLDQALGTWYPAAGKLANLLHAPRQAMGHTGPTDATFAPAVFGAPDRVEISPGTRMAAVAALKHRIIVADLTAVHQSRKDQKLYDGGLSGSHSDIAFDEIYQMICGFFFE